MSCAALAMTLAAGCSDGGTPEAKVHSAGGNPNYGEERIGYKTGVPREDPRELGAGPSDPPAGSAEDLGGALGGGNAADSGVIACTPPVPGTEDAGIPEDCVTPDEDAGVPNETNKQRSEGDPGVVLENPYFDARAEPLSTFALDVDGASYSLTRAGLRAGHRPNPADVRLEEFLNYFHLHYQQPDGEEPLSLYAEMADCPWNPKHKLMMLGVQGQEVELKDVPANNLVFLLDVSGSMSAPNKLPLVKKGFRMLTQLLRPQDRVSIVTYAGAEQVVLDAARGDDRERIDAALDNLEAGGSTNGAGGIQRAYELAQEHFIEGGNNRVLLATDGDFNVGISDVTELGDFIAKKRGKGIYLSFFGFGDAWDGGNYKDATGEELSKKGDGIYFYIDSEEEARRAFLHTASGALITVAKDVKVQVEVNPQHFAAYRLLGYENRLLANADFENDAVDGGELGASLSMTALYELIPADADEALPTPREGSVPMVEPAAASDDGEPTLKPSVTFDRALQGEERVAVRLRYKGPDGGKSALLSKVYGPEIARDAPSLKWIFASTLAELAASLRGSQYQPDRGAETLRSRLKPVLAIDREGAVQEVIDLLTHVP